MNAALDAHPRAGQHGPVRRGLDVRAPRRRRRRRRGPPGPAAYQGSAGLTPGARAGDAWPPGRKALRTGAASPRVCTLLTEHRPHDRGSAASSSGEREGRQLAPCTSRRRCASRASRASSRSSRRRGRRPLSKADQATVDALRPGTALLVVLRGPNTGARFLLDDDEVNVRPAPRQRHLPRRRHRLAQARRLPPRGRRLRRPRRRLAQRHLRQPRARRRGHAARPATRSRSASSGSSSTPEPAA